MLRLELRDTLLNFTDDLFVGGSVRLISIEPTDMERVVAVENEYGLDFDDAYQYVAAELNGVSVVSFDSDFDNTELGRITPLQIMTQR